MYPFIGTPRHLVALAGAWVFLVAPFASLRSATDTTAPRPTRIRAIIRSELPAYDARLHQPREKPTADVVELDPFEIVEQRADEPFESDAAREARLRREALRRHPGSLAPGQSLNDQRMSNYGALQMRDDQRQANVDRLTHFTNVLAQTERKADAKAYKREWQQALIRNSDWRTEGMDRTVNGWRN